MEEGELEEEGAQGAAGGEGGGDGSDGGDGGEGGDEASKRVKRSHGAEGGKPAKKHGPPAAGYVCKACHQPGHWLEQCPRYEEYKNGPPPAGYVCAKCNMPGHWVHNCAAASGMWRTHTAARPQEEAANAPIIVGLDARDVGEELAENLEELAPEVVELLCKCAQVLGEDECRQLIVQVWQLENSGGLLTLDGTNRRRTPGGVFFWLVKQKVSATDRARLFPTPVKRHGAPTNGGGGGRHANGAATEQPQPPQPAA